MANLIPGVSQGSDSTVSNVNIGAPGLTTTAKPLNNNVSGNGVPLPAIKQPLTGGQVTGGPTPIPGAGLPGTQLPLAQKPATQLPAYTIPRPPNVFQGQANNWRTSYHPLVAEALQNGQQLHPALLHPTVNDAMLANQPLHPAIVQAIQTGQQLHPDIVHTLQQSISGPAAQPFNGSPGYGNQGRGFEGGQATGQPMQTYGNNTPRPLYYGPGYGNQGRGNEGGGLFQGGPQPAQTPNVFQGGPQPVANGYNFKGL